MKSLQSTVYRLLQKKQQSVVGSRKALTQGLTLIEILVAMGIATIAGVLLLVIIVNSAGIFTKQMPKVSQGLNINDGLSIVRNSIKQAYGVASQYTNGSTTYTSGATQLILQLSSIDSTGNIIENTFDYFVFYLDQNYFRFKAYPDIASIRKSEDRVLANLVESLNFQYLNSTNPPQEVIPTNAQKIRVSLKLNQKAGADYETSIATSEANIRNN